MLVFAYIAKRASTKKNLYCSLSRIFQLHYKLQPLLRQFLPVQTVVMLCNTFNNSFYTTSHHPLPLHLIFMSSIQKNPSLKLSYICLQSSIKSPTFCPISLLKKLLVLFVYFLFFCLLIHHHHPRSSSSSATSQNTCMFVYKLLRDELTFCIL